ncbi:MAG: RraA family protein [Chitinophagaceae bacterium]|nr:RraA family protein [Chitinophagaceae bacterium]
MLTHAELLELKRWNTPTIYNGWEQITRRNAGKEGFNIEETHDFMPMLGAMVGYAVTLVIAPGDPSHLKDNISAWSEYRKYAASAPGPNIVVVQDLDKPDTYGSFWGEVNANLHRALGCVGAITDGGIRDVDEMTAAGFKVLARRLCVGHAFVIPVKWNCEVEVFGCKIQPGQLIHADKHGFLAINEEEEKELLNAARFMDTNECQTLIEAAKTVSGKTLDEILEAMDNAARNFGDQAKKRFGKSGEWIFDKI